MTLAWDEPAYLKRFAEVQEKIRAGDIYQLNLTFKARFRLSGSPLTFFLDLRQKQRVAYGGIVDTGKVTVLSASPELFIEQEGRKIATRPMKGTAPRAGTLEADALAQRQLAEDVKQRAENLMIVDLMRNDIGRISEIGSVNVTDLFTVETFQTLHQMTSGVEATLKQGIGIAELLRGIFPPGSVIGAPKIRAMELIAALETEPRGVYCGAIGHISPKGSALFNVAIRTAVVFRDAFGEMGIGSGVVFDSAGTKEYAECLLKMKFLTDPVKPFELIETMLYESEAAASFCSSATSSASRRRPAISPSPATRRPCAARSMGQLPERSRAPARAAAVGGAGKCHGDDDAAAGARSSGRHALRRLRHAAQQRRHLPFPQDDAARAL